MKRLYLYITVLAVIGTILALFLSWEQLFHPAFQPCRINSTVNCDAIISGVVAKIFGIPTPLYGLTGYVIILFAAQFKKKKILFITATFGLTFCLWIAYVELIQLRVLCPLCILCDIIMIMIFFVSFHLLQKKS